MPLDFDDWDVFDRTETVTYTVFTPAGAETDDATVSAIKFQNEHTPVLGEVVGTMKQALWHLRRSTLAGVTPALGDRITQADGTVWVVLQDVTQQTDGARWRLRCQLLEGSGGDL